MELRGATALVTGAGRRLGQAVALSLAERGVKLLLHVHSSPATDLVTEIEKRGGYAEVITADLSIPGGGERLAQEVLFRAGTIEVLVNSAAVFFATPLLSLSADDWRRMLCVNLAAPLTLAVGLGRIMKARGRGKIIQLGDWSGQRPVRNYLPYCVAKGGLHTSTAVLAKAFAPHVQVNEVVLGPVLPPVDYDARALQAISDATPLQRLGQPLDVIRTVRFLLEEGDFVTGASYVVDGGWLAQSPEGMTTSL